MMKKAFEWLAGSVVVYVVVAACSAARSGDEKRTSQSDAGGAAPKSSAGMGASGDVGGELRGTGANSDESGGSSILDPIPDADAAEDGQRIVNIYRTTAGGLRTHEGYWDTELGATCTFQKQSDGKEYCLPQFEAVSAYRFADSACTEPVVEIACGAPAPKNSVGVLEFVGACGVPSYAPYRAGPKLSLSTHYLKTSVDGPCTETALTEGADYYGVGAKFALDDLVEGFTDR